MTRSLFIPALALVLVSNAYVLVQVARNRGGERDAELLLDAREFFPSPPNSSDDSLASLTLRWNNPSTPYPPTDVPEEWFDRRKLEDSGLDVSVPAESPDAARFYRTSRSREVFVALEFDGPSWQKWLDAHKTQIAFGYAPSTSKARTDLVEAERQNGSRLVAIDVSRDAGNLRRKYPNRQQVMILRGLARAEWDGARTGRPARVRGILLRLSNESLYVNREFRPLPNPTLSVTVAVGPRFEPWIVDVKNK